jgi:hypothetical protein
MNLNDFPLHNNDKIVIEKWHKSYDKPLFISGKIGIGKTSLYETLLKDFTIVVVEHKLIKNYEEFIKNTIYETDISMMFSKRKYKAIIFDNISYTDRNLIQYLKNITKNYTKTPFIITCNDFNNKQIQSISNNCYHIYLKYTYEQYYDKCKLLFSNILDNLVYDSDFNFHMIQSNYNFYDKDYKKSNSFLDSYITDINILTDNFKLEYNTETLFQKYSCDYNTISLNILDDIGKFKSNDLNSICKIYENIITYDIYEGKRIKYNISENDISILYSIYMPYSIVKNDKIKLSKNISYNSYTSKSLIYTHIGNLPNISHYDDYFDILKLLLKEDFDSIKKYNINKKLFNNYIKLYENLYDTKICKKNIKKLYDIIK